MPTDLYYASLFKDDGSFNDWDGNKDGYFGEVPSADSAKSANPDDVHVIPQIAIGRILASNENEVKTYVSKVKEYEENTYGAAWFKASLLIASTNWMADACVKQDYIAQNYLNSAQAIKLYQKENSPCPITEAPTPANINFYINQGVGFVSYIGHG